MCWHSPGMGCLEFWSQVPSVWDSHSFNRHLPPCVVLDARVRRGELLLPAIQTLSRSPHSLSRWEVSRGKKRSPLPFLAIEGSALQGLKVEPQRLNMALRRHSVWLTHCFIFKFFSHIEKEQDISSESSRFWLGPEPRLDAESNTD